ncbi:hypothetical protein O1611_g3986 [Lasiodiplodia mahajangana]|uniref:Uncharacterized protein n=1 Tax=Lasiodiplodia mahajangana TaxID=1108764 RepID=A0ACC2JQ92_9PEZI|nr:hypothetical protein O1611_g3986 [Lasiodiplodia mahajangana]
MHRLAFGVGLEKAIRLKEQARRTEYRSSCYHEGRSSGTLPDIRPKPEPNETCASYVAKQDDSCPSTGAANGLAASEVEDFNKVKTWGLTVVRTSALGSGSVCLSEFCVPTTGRFGNPSTGPPGSNGCASSCGREIIDNDEAPGSFISVGYYESWNLGRPCLTMNAKSIDGLKYTHVYWGFGRTALDMSNDICSFESDEVLGTGTRSCWKEPQDSSNDKPPTCLWGVAVCPDLKVCAYANDDCTGDYVSADGDNAGPFSPSGSKVIKSAQVVKGSDSC